MKLMNVYATQGRINAEIESIGTHLADCKLESIELVRKTDSVGFDLLIGIEGGKEYARHYEPRWYNLMTRVVARLKNIHNLYPFNGKSQ